MIMEKKSLIASFVCEACLCLIRHELYMTANPASKLPSPPLARISENAVHQYNHSFDTEVGITKETTCAELRNSIDCSS